MLHSLLQRELNSTDSSVEFLRYFLSHQYRKAPSTNINPVLVERWAMCYQSKTREFMNRFTWCAGAVCSTRGDCHEEVCDGALVAVLENSVCQRSTNAYARASVRGEKKKAEGGTRERDGVANRAKNRSGMGKKSGGFSRLRSQMDWKTCSECENDTKTSWKLSAALLHVVVQ